MLAISAVWIWGLYDYNSYAKAEVEGEKRYCELIISAAEGAMHRECQCNNLQMERLERTLEDVRKRVGANYLGIYYANGEPFISTGTPETMEKGRIIKVSRSFRFPKAAMPGMKPKEECKKCLLPPGNMEIRLEYPSRRLEQRLREGWKRFLVVSVGLSVTFLSLFLFYLGFLRATALKAELLAARERVKSLGFLSRLGAGLAHETKNPLGAIRGFGELLMRKGLDNEKAREAAKRIVDETDRIVARLDEFLLLSRPAKLRLEKFEIKAMLEDLASLVGFELAGKNGEIHVHGEEAYVRADPGQARRLFMNLLVNAAEALKEKGEIKVRVHARDDRVVVEIIDDGPGVPPEIRETLFEPYVTGKVGGTGLGLAIAKRIAMEHKWELKYRPGKDGGTTMTVEIPRMKP